ncbi:MAG: site-specific integrase [Desulfitobacterium hafniense]|nr:site-specific integrase [Desulfitobacterium hafniense]
MAEKMKTLKPSTVRKLIFVLNKILREILKDKNPCKDVAPPADDDFKPHVITDEEFEQIHNAVRGTRDEPIVLLSGWCGLRRGEIFALKWDDIDWEKELIRIDESRCITDKGCYIDKDPKSDNGFRNVVVPTELMDLLKELRKSQATVEMKVKPLITVKSKVKPEARIWNTRPDTIQPIGANWL